MLEEAKIVSFDVGLRVYIAHAQERERERSIQREKDSERNGAKERRRRRGRSEDINTKEYKARDILRSFRSDPRRVCAYFARVKIRNAVSNTVETTKHTRSC